MHAPFKVTTGGGVSPMLLADRMLTLAEQADRAGLTQTAVRLLTLAHDVFDEVAVPYLPARRLGAPGTLGDQAVVRLVATGGVSASVAAIAR